MAKRLTTTSNRGFVFGLVYAQANVSALAANLLTDVVLLGRNRSPRVLVILGAIAYAAAFALASCLRGDERAAPPAAEGGDIPPPVPPPAGVPPSPDTAAGRHEFPQEAVAAAAGEGAGGEGAAHAEAGRAQDVAASRAHAHPSTSLRALLADPSQRGPLLRYVAASLALVPMSFLWDQLALSLPKARHSSAPLAF